MNQKNNVLLLAHGGVIAAIYVVLTIFINSFGLANGAIQVRISEALTILPFFTPAAVPGLFVGCLLSNILTGCAIWDIVFGSIATLIGALGSYALRKNKWLVPLPPIIANTIIVPIILKNVYQFEGSFWYFAATVGIGEILSCGVLGMILLFALDKRKEIFRTN